MKRKLSLFLAMLLTISLLCSTAFEDRSPSHEDVDPGDVNLPPVDILTTYIEDRVSIDGNGSATVRVASRDLMASVKAVKERGFVRVSVDVKDADDASSMTIVLPKEGLKAVAEQTNADLKVESAVGQVTLSNATLTSVVEAADGDDVSIVVGTQDSSRAQTLLDGRVSVDAGQIAASSVAEVSATSGGTAITKLSGCSATVALPVDSGNFQEGKSYIAYQADADGSVHTLVGQCKRADGRLQVSLPVKRLGTFMVTSKAVANSTVSCDEFMSPLARSAAAEAESPSLFAAVQKWCDAAVTWFLRMSER